MTRRLDDGRGDAMTKLRCKRCSRALLTLAAFCGLNLAIACKSPDPEPKTSSETNFLKHCASECGDGLSCLCGVCTKACTGTNECTEIATEATCLPVPERPDSGTEDSCQQGATCDVACVKSADCNVLGEGYQCETGFCRKGNLVCPTTILPAGDLQRQIVVAGTTRSYAMHVPANYSGHSSVPLVLDFHPMGLGLEWERANSGYAELADQAGFIVIWPQGLENAWNIGPCCTTSRTIDDFAFARALVKQISIDACIDPRRVYAVGFSLGGAVAYYLACRQAEVFAAVAVSSMDLAVDSELSCQPSLPVTEIAFRGSADTVVPYGGGATSPPGHPEMSFNVLGAVGTFERWARLDQCTGTPSAQDANGCSTYSACEAGAEVSLCTTQDGGQVMGSASVAWELLKRHPMTR